MLINGKFNSFYRISNFFFFYIGMDCFNDDEMSKLNNWLMFGLSNSEIYGSNYKDTYNDCVFVISKDGFQAYVVSSAYKEFSNLSTLLCNCNVYCLTKADEKEQERQEILKMSKFYEMVHDKKVIGMPVRRIKGWKDYDDEIQMVEKWPIIQAYGLDIVGQGFFTMKHNYKNIRDELDFMYKEFDSFSKYRIVNEEIERLNVHFFDNFFNFNKDSIQKRQQRTEYELVEHFYQRWQFSLLQLNQKDEGKSKDGLPVPRVLIGKNSNKDSDYRSDKDIRLYKFGQEMDDNALHFTMEYVDKNSSLRFGRTYFLSNLSSQYMKDTFFSENDDYRVKNKKGKENELNSEYLLNIYTALIRSFKDCEEKFVKQEIKKDNIGDLAYDNFVAYLRMKTPISKNDFECIVQSVDTFGSEAKGGSGNCENQSLAMIRMQVKNIVSQVNGENLGSVLYSQTLMMIDENSIHINITKNIPNL